MNWININVDTLRSCEFVGAEPVERATWLSLLGWSCGQENSGVIENCKNWSSRKWQQLCGVMKEEVLLESELYHFEGDNLFIHFYPLEQQASVVAKRENGKKGGRPKKNTTPQTLDSEGEKPHGYPHGYPKNNHMGNLEETLKKRKEKKRKEKERNMPSAEDDKKTEMKTRVAALVKRLPTTKWSEREMTTFRKLKPTIEDVEFLENCQYSEHPYRRRDLLTLLNNWSGELDRMNAQDLKPVAATPARRFGV